MELDRPISTRARYEAPLASTVEVPLPLPLPPTQPILTRTRTQPPPPPPPAATAAAAAYNPLQTGRAACAALWQQAQASIRRACRFLDAHLGVALLVAVLALVAIGSVVVYSASAKVAMETARIGDPAHFFKRHLFAVGLALLAMTVACTLSVERWRWLAPKLYVAALFALVLVLIPGLGTELNGARRWFRFGGGLGFQPSDLAKVALVLMLAAHLSRLRVQRSLGQFAGGFLPVAALIAPIGLLIVVAPDFGTTMFVCTLAGTVFLVAGGRLRHIGLVALPGLLALAAVVVAKFDHVRPRLETFLNPEADPSGAGYQVLQGLIAVGAGGPMGVGLGQSRQSLFYLPEMSTDFIFAILAEEFGFIGTSFVLLLYLGVALLGFRIAARAASRFAQLVAVGLTLAIVLQAVMNVAVVTAAVPNTGIPLPFISYGGSLTFFYLLGVGILLSVARSLPPAATAATNTPVAAESKTQAKADALARTQRQTAPIRWPANASTQPLPERAAAPEVERDETQEREQERESERDPGPISPSWSERRQQRSTQRRAVVASRTANAASVDVRTITMKLPAETHRFDPRHSYYVPLASEALPPSESTDQSWTWEPPPPTADERR